MRYSPLLLLLLCAPLQAEQFLVDSSGASAGTYALVIHVDSSGNTSVTKVTKIISLAGTAPSPDPDTPEVPQDPKSLSDKVALWTSQVNDPESAAKLSVGYRTVADQIAAGAFKSKAQIVRAQAAINDSLLTGTGDRWSDWRGKVNDELAVLESAGKLNDIAAMQPVWNDIASGLAQQSAAIDRDRLRELIMLILKILLPILIGG